MTLGVALVVFYAALGTKALERESVADKSKWSAALVTTLHHDLHRTLEVDILVVRQVLPCASANATVIRHQRYKVWLRWRARTA